MKHGAKVLAIDGNILSEKFIYNNIPAELLQNFSRDKQRLERLKLPKNALCFSAKTLSAVGRAHFVEMMGKITESIEPEGYFVGNFFGERTNFSDKLSYVDESKITSIFKDFTILYINEREFDTFHPLRQIEEHRHYRDVIAQKK